MSKLFFAIVFSFFTMTAHAGMVDEMLHPSAKITSKNGSGSATAIKVDSILGTYLLTNYHVVKGNLDSLMVQFYGSEVKYPAYVHSVDVQNDLAVIITRHQHTAVALVGTSTKVFDEVYCVGSSLGADIAPSKGIISGANVKMFGTRYLTRTDCKIINGNSGGGLFAKQDGVWKLVGVPVMITSVSIGFGSRVPITFLGFAIRIKDVRWYLYRNGVLRLAQIHSAR